MSILAWHFLPEDGRLANDGTLVCAGAAYSVDPPIVLCQHGLHGSKRLIDALTYAPGPIVCRTRHSGEIVQADDKLVSEHRKVVWMYDASAVLHEFACRCAEDALSFVDKPEERSLAAIAAKRAWLCGEIGDEELTAAWAAAWDAAAAAAAAGRAAAWDVACSTAARSAACTAARAAAWAAACTAAGAGGLAAWAAACTATRAAAWDAACAAARAAQNKRLTSMIVAGRKAA